MNDGARTGEVFAERVLTDGSTELTLKLYRAHVAPDFGYYFEIVQGEQTVHESVTVGGVDDIHALIHVLTLAGDHFARDYPDHSLLGLGTTGLLQTDFEERRFSRATTWFPLEPPAGLIVDESWKLPPLPPELFAD